MPYKLLTEFRGLFDGVKYLHRVSNQGDRVASFLYEDLRALGRSPKLVAVISSKSHVINSGNKTVGKDARRGDGTFGERVPNVPPIVIPGISVAFGEVATLEIGAEVKVLAKAMRKQLDRVCTDLANQVTEFKKHGGNPICVGVVGVNRADSYTSYEGRRSYPTDGKKYPHPKQEADQVEQDITNRVRSKFDELLLLRFRASNKRPYSFSWVDQPHTEAEYGAALLRVSIAYESRF